MSELRYPNESREYRDARDSLLKDEQELIDKVKSVAERWRNLPQTDRARGSAAPAPWHQEPGKNIQPDKRQVTIAVRHVLFSIREQAGLRCPLLRSSLVNRHKMPEGQVIENKRPTV
jgi:hypothetical protein